MRLRIADYKVHREALKNIADRRTPAQRYDLIGEYAATNNCPIIASAVFMGEMYGFTPELHAFIGRLIAFYHLEAVDGYDPA